MEYQKIVNLIDDNTLAQPSKFRTRNWIEINDESRGAYNFNSQVKFKTSLKLVYVIIVMHIFLLRALLLLIALLLKVLLLIILIKK